MVSMLLRFGANTNASDDAGITVLHLATDGGLLTITAQLFNAGADVNCTDKDGLTPLYSAAGAGHQAIVRILLERGASTDIKMGPRDYEYERNKIKSPIQFVR